MLEILFQSGIKSSKAEIFGLGFRKPSSSLKSALESKLIKSFELSEELKRTEEKSDSSSSSSIIMLSSDDFSDPDSDSDSSSSSTLN